MQKIRLSAKPRQKRGEMRSFPQRGSEFRFRRGSHGPAVTGAGMRPQVCHWLCQCLDWNGTGRASGTHSIIHHQCHPPFVAARRQDATVTRTRNRGFQPRSRCFRSFQPRSSARRSGSLLPHNPDVRLCDPDFALTGSWGRRAGDEAAKNASVPPTGSLRCENESPFNGVDLDG